jgi:hypothetical protein
MDTHTHTSTAETPMGKKHSEDDAQQGLPKFVRDNLNKAVRNEAQRQKVAKSKGKTNDRDGKGKR